MFFLSSKKLEKALAYNLLDEWEKTKYLILTAIYHYLFIVPAGIIRPYSGAKPPSINQWFNLANSVLSLLIVIFCLKRCFRTNKAIDNLNFIERYTILFVPISIRVFLFILLPVFILLILILNSIRPQYPEVFNYFSIPLTVISPAIILVYFHMLNNSLKRFGFELANRTDETITLTHTCLLAVVSLFLAIFSLSLDIVFQVPVTSLCAIVCGHLARRRIKNDQNLTGLRVALFGLIIGYIRCITLIITTVDMLAMKA
jgi:hypothetical protein